MKIHQLKSWPAEFYLIKNGHKRATLRVDDRPFKVGDILALTEFNPQWPEDQQYGCLTAQITHIQRCAEPPLEELPEGWVLLSLHLLPA
jgi:hypothetical protein